MSEAQRKVRNFDRHSGSLPRLRRAQVLSLHLREPEFKWLWRCDRAGTQTGWGKDPLAAYCDWVDKAHGLQHAMQNHQPANPYIVRGPMGEWWQTAEQQDPTKWGH